MASVSSIPTTKSAKESLDDFPCLSLPLMRTKLPYFLTFIVGVTAVLGASLSMLQIT